MPADSISIKRDDSLDISKISRKSGGTSFGHYSHHKIQQKDKSLAADSNIEAAKDLVRGMISAKRDEARLGNEAHELYS